jgi:acetyl esterase
MRKEVTMTIDQDLLKYYAKLAADFEPLVEPDAQARRARFAAIAARYAAPRPDTIKVQALELPLAGRTLAARLYQPAGSTARLPLLVYFHGGGWVVGDLDTHDDVAVRLALDARIAVCSVDYRLAPEFPYPAPANDALDALMWLAEHRARLGLALNTLGVGGDSAGAHLAAAAARVANTKVPGLVKAQLLHYPAVSAAMATASMMRLANEPGLSAADMAYYWREFLGDASVQADDTSINLMATPPARQPADAVVVLAGHDPLHDEGREYARFLDQHGADVEVIEAHDMTHGFVRLQGESAAARAWALQAAQALGRLLGA